MRRIAKSLITLSLLSVFNIAHTQSTPKAEISSIKPLIIDTDMGTDDWLAIAYIAQNQKIDLLGVTIVGNGIATCEYAGRNAQYLLSLSTRNKDKPIGCGSNWPMDGFASYPTPWRETSKDMMGEKIPSSTSSKIYPDGPTLLAELLRSSKRPVDILAIGSMTNIATVLSVEPELKEKITRIYSMGGAVKVNGNLRVPGFTDSHSNTKAEWNYYIDPIAAKIVFTSGVPITLVPLDATNKVPLTKDCITRLQREQQQPLEAFADRIFKNILQSTTNGEYYHWDPLTAAVAANPEFCDQTQTYLLDIVTSTGTDQGLPNGQPSTAFPLTNAEGKKRNALNELSAGATLISNNGKKIDVCMHVNAPIFEKNFIETLRTTN